MKNTDHHTNAVTTQHDPFLAHGRGQARSTRCSQRPGLTEGRSQT